MNTQHTNTKLVLIALLLITTFSLNFKFAKAITDDGFVPNGSGSNTDEVPVVTPPPPTGQGSNDAEAPDIIPNGQGTNGNEGDSSIIPSGQGSNDDENSAPAEILPFTPPVGQGANGPEGSTTQQTSDVSPVSTADNSRPADSGSSSGGSSFGQTITPTLTTAPTLPITADSCIYINDYMRLGAANNPAEVTKLQQFLSTDEGITVPITGIFDQVTSNAVKTFQEKYLNETMAPWGLKTGSGIVSYTTKKKINELYCKATFALTSEQLATIQNYKKLLSTPRPAPVAPQNVTPAPEATSTIDSSVVGFNTPSATDNGVEAPVIPANTISLPPVSQTAAAADASPGFIQNILNFFKNLF